MNDMQTLADIAGMTAELIESGKLVCVVRCKDCRHWLPMDRFHHDYHPGRGDCELNCWVRDSDWFCADGELKE